MAEIRIRVSRDVFLYGLPETVVVSDLLAEGADRNDPAQRLNLVEIPSELPILLVQPVVQLEER